MHLQYRYNVDSFDHQTRSALKRPPPSEVKNSELTKRLKESESRISSLEKEKQDLSLRLLNNLIVKNASSATCMMNIIFLIRSKCNNNKNNNNYMCTCIMTVLIIVLVMYNSFTMCNHPEMYAVIPTQSVINFT